MLFGMKHSARGRLGSMCDPVVPSKRGPQARAARNDRAVLEAARHVFITQGFEAPVSAIAEQAGVGIGSLYRRYRTKEELLQRLSVDSVDHVAAAAQEALHVEDPWQGVVQYVQQCVAFGCDIASPLEGTITETEEMRRASELAEQRTGELIARAHEAGVLRRDVTARDVSLLIGQLTCPPAGVPDPELAHRRLVAIAVDGLHARNSGALPDHGCGPSRCQTQTEDAAVGY